MECNPKSEQYTHWVVFLLGSVDRVYGADAVRVALLLVLVAAGLPVKLGDVVRDGQGRDLVVYGKCHRVGLTRGSWKVRFCIWQLAGKLIYY